MPCHPRNFVHGVAHVSQQRHECVPGPMQLDSSHSCGLAEFREAMRYRVRVPRLAVGVRAHEIAIRVGIEHLLLVKPAPSHSLTAVRSGSLLHPRPRHRALCPSSCPHAAWPQGVSADYRQSPRPGPKSRPSTRAGPFPTPSVRSRISPAIEQNGLTITFSVGIVIRLPNSRRPLQKDLILPYLSDGAELEVLG